MVSDVWEVPRSTYYVSKHRQREAPVPKKRGPKMLVSDTELLELIRKDLATTLFTSEGHRNVWWRIRFVKGISVRWKRV